MIMMLAFVEIALLVAIYFVVDAYGKIMEQIQELEREASRIDAAEIREHQGLEISWRLKEKFGASLAQMDALRRQQLGYGEIAIIISMADQLPGGVDDENIQRIVELRRNEERRSWGNITQELGVRLAHVIQEVKEVKNSLSLDQYLEGPTVRLEKVA